MHSHDNNTRHMQLAGRMAQALGVDLKDLAETGQVNGAELDRIVSRCTTCSDPDDCETLLEYQPGGLDFPLYYCRNQTVFQRLMAQCRT